MIDGRRTPTSSPANVAPFPDSVGSATPVWLDRLPLALAGTGFGLMLLSDAIDPLVLILLQIYLAF